MSKSNGRHRRRNIERLASALQDCLDEAADTAAKTAADTAAKAVADTVAKATADTAAKAAADRFDAKWRPLFDQQNETLRMIWQQCGGKAEQRLPIDD